MSNYFWRNPIFCLKFLCLNKRRSENQASRVATQKRHKSQKRNAKEKQQHKQKKIISKDACLFIFWTLFKSRFLFLMRQWMERKKERMEKRKKEGWRLQNWKNITFQWQLNRAACLWLRYSLTHWFAPPRSVHFFKSNFEVSQFFYEKIIRYKTRICVMYNILHWKMLAQKL